MKTRQFVVIINGPAGSGKTTIAKELWQRLPRTALICLDDIKWAISDCGDQDLDTASAVGQAMVKKYLEAGLNVIIEKAFLKAEYVKPFVDIAEQSKATVYQFCIEAPLPVLIERTRKRYSKRKKMPISKVQRIHRDYVENRYGVTKLFDSSVVPVPKITEAILKHITS